MKPSVFITGISGFLGRSLLSVLDTSTYETIFLLVREPESLLIPDNVDNIKIVIGDLNNPDSYAEYLDSVETVIHLAALTGKVKKKDYDDINFMATSRLIDLSKQNGVKKFLFISTIAVKFKKKRGYCYALSKEKAENYLKESGMEFTIFRPTIILGAGSAVFSGFSRFIGMPLIPFFGRGNIIVQPVDVKDVAQVIDVFSRNAHFDNKVYEIGGPDKVTLKDLILNISKAKNLKKRILSIPLFISTPLIMIADKLFYGFTPVTLGQLATFRNNGEASSDDLIKKIVNTPSSLEDMISDSIAGEKKENYKISVKKECKLFCRYLIGSEPTPYVVDKYFQFLKKVDNNPKDEFDLFLINFANKSLFFTRLSDSFSRFFRSDSLLRKRLGFLFAIIETSPEIYKKVDIIKEMNFFTLFITMAFKGTVFAFSLILSLPILMPLKIIKPGNKKIRPEDSSDE